MNPDDRLRKSSRRLNIELDKMTVPAPPTRSGGRISAFAVGAVATVVVIAGGAYLLGSISDRAPTGEAGSSTTTSAPPGTGTTVGPIGPVDYQGRVTVIDDGDGPVVCSGGVMESFPPQCSGPALHGLDWADVPWAESANGVTWADMAIVVSIEDDDSLTLAEAPAEPGDYPTGEDVDFTPPCPAPEGGWAWTGGPMTSQADFDAATEYVGSQPDLSANWVYNLITDPYEADATGRFEVVLVALFTGDLVKHETEISALWGGPLCVAEGVTNSAELQDLQDQITSMMVDGTVPGVIGFGWSYPDDIHGTVVFGALIATPEAYEWLAANYADAPIRLESQLQPVATTSPQAWEEPANYSFVVNQTCGEQALIGSFEVHVVDHAVDTASGLDAPAEAMLENLGLEPVPTIVDILAGVERAVSTGAEVAEVTYDDAGVPEVITIDFDSDVIDDESCYVISEYQVG